MAELSRTSRSRCVYFPVWKVLCTARVLASAEHWNRFKQQCEDPVWKVLCTAGVLASGEHGNRFKQQCEDPVWRVLCTAGVLASADHGNRFKQQCEDPVWMVLYVTALLIMLYIRTRMRSLRPYNAVFMDIRVIQ